MTSIRTLVLVSCIALLSSCVSVDNPRIHTQRPPVLKKELPDTTLSETDTSAQGKEAGENASDQRGQAPEDFSSPRYPDYEGEHTGPDPGALVLQMVPHIEPGHADDVLVRSLPLPVYRHLGTDTPETRENKTDGKQTNNGAAEGAAVSSSSSVSSSSAVPEAVKKPETPLKTSTGPQTKQASAYQSSAGTEKNMPGKSEGSGSAVYDDIIQASVGDSIQISFPGRTWIFDKQKSEISGVSFQDTQYLQSSKEFIFTAEHAGESVLIFSRQDLSSGTSETNKIKVDVRTGGDIYTQLEDMKTTDRPADEGQAPEEGFSWETLQRQLSERNIEGISRQLQRLNGALISLEKSGGAGTQEGEGELNWEKVIKAAGILEGSMHESAAVEALKLYLDSAPDVNGSAAEVYYLLGRLYESPPYPRDEREAVRYYKRVMNIFPTDIYHFKAEERIKYLERHFLQIR